MCCLGCHSFSSKEQASFNFMAAVTMCSEAPWVTLNKSSSASYEGIRTFPSSVFRLCLPLHRLHFTKGWKCWLLSVLAYSPHDESYVFFFWLNSEPWPHYPQLSHGLNPDNHDGVITHLEPDILECEVRWALGRITMSKASGGDEIPVELFQILKDDAVKVLHSICQQIWKTQQWPQDWKRSVSSQYWRKAMARTAQTTTHTHLTHELSNAQNSSSQAPTVCEPWTSRCSCWI